MSSIALFGTLLNEGTTFGACQNLGLPFEKFAMSNRPPFAVVRLKKLKEAPQSKYLLRLLAALNDLDSLAVLIKALDTTTKEESEYLHIKRRNGASLYLLRQQSAIVYSVIFDCIWTMNEKVEVCRKQTITNKTPASLWTLIVCSENLTDRLIELKRLFEESAKNFGYVRDKLASHIDLPAVSSGLTRLSHEHDLGILFADRNWCEFRALFVDDVLSESWQKDAFKLQLGEHPTAEQINDHAKTIFDLKAQTAEFAHALFMEYCQKFELFGDQQERETVSKELDDFKGKPAENSSTGDS